MTGTTQRRSGVWKRRWLRYPERGRVAELVIAPASKAGASYGAAGSSPVPSAITHPSRRPGGGVEVERDHRIANESDAKRLCLIGVLYPDR